MGFGFSSLVRFTASATFGVCLVAGVAGAAEQSGEVTIRFTYATTTTEKVLDFDGEGVRTKVVKREGTMTCPVQMSGEIQMSYIDLLPVEQFGVPRELKEGAFGRFHTWMSENCTGSITANDEVTVRSARGKVTLVDKITGTRPLASTVDANFVAETNLDKARTRYWIVTPMAEGFPRQGIQGRPTDRAAALPDDNVIVGPLPGPLKNGGIEKKVPGGGYKVEWVFQRKR